MEPPFPTWESGLGVVYPPVSVDRRDVVPPDTRSAQTWLNVSLLDPFTPTRITHVPSAAGRVRDRPLP